jgi:hypothetical protein
VETLLAAIDRQLAEQPPKPPPPAPAVAPPPRVEAHPPPAAPAVDRPREQPPRPWYRRPATWIVVAIVAAVIAGGAIALGLTIGRRPPQPNSGTIVVMP